MTYYPESQEDEPFRVRCYRKSELAMLYFPQYSAHATMQHLRRWILRCTELHEALKKSGYRGNGTHYFLRSEVELIVRYLGEP